MNINKLNVVNKTNTDTKNVDYENNQNCKSVWKYHSQIADIVYIATKLNTEFMEFTHHISEEVEEEVTFTVTKECQTIAPTHQPSSEGSVGYVFEATVKNLSVLRCNFVSRGDGQLSIIHLVTNPADDGQTKEDIAETERETGVGLSLFNLENRSRNVGEIFDQLSCCNGETIEEMQDLVYGKDNEFDHICEVGVGLNLVGEHRLHSGYEKDSFEHETYCATTQVLDRPDSSHIRNELLPARNENLNIGVIDGEVEKNAFPEVEDFAEVRGGEDVEVTALREKLKLLGCLEGDANEIAVNKGHVIKSQLCSGQSSTLREQIERPPRGLDSQEIELRNFLYAQRFYWLAKICVRCFPEVDKGRGITASRDSIPLISQANHQDDVKLDSFKDTKGKDAFTMTDESICKNVAINSLFRQNYSRAANDNNYIISSQWVHHLFNLIFHRFFITSLTCV